MTSTGWAAGMARGLPPISDVSLMGLTARLVRSRPSPLSIWHRTVHQSSGVPIPEAHEGSAFFARFGTPRTNYIRDNNYVTISV